MSNEKISYGEVSDLNLLIVLSRSTQSVHKREENLYLPLSFKIILLISNISTREEINMGV